MTKSTERSWSFVLLFFAVHCVHVHVLLREGKADAFLVEVLLDGLGEFETNVPVVFGPGPGAGNEIDGRSSQFADSDLWRSFVENTLVGYDDFLQNGLGFVGIVVVANADDKLDVAIGAGGDVGDDVVPDLAVGTTTTWLSPLAIFTALISVALAFSGASQASSSASTSSRVSGRIWASRRAMEMAGSSAVVASTSVALSVFSTSLAASLASLTS
jgi:hypothetical protein